MASIVKRIPGYCYGAPEVGVSLVSLEELETLKVTVGFTAQDTELLRKAGEVLAAQTTQIVQHWRSGIIATIPNTDQKRELGRHGGHYRNKQERKAER